MNCLSVLVKPTHSCNLRCKYCYNAETKYVDEKLGIALFRKMVQCIPAYYQHISFVWLGGEPLLMGLDFYVEVLRIQRDLLPNRSISNHLTTNGTLMSQQFAKFFASSKFQVAFSFDGECNEKYRTATKETLRGMEIFSTFCRKQIVVLKVVQDEDLLAPEEVYNFFATRNMNFQLNPIIGRYDTDANHVMYGPEAYAEFLIEIFDAWINDANNSIIVEPLARYLKALLKGKSTVCCHSMCIGKYICIDPKGNLFPCSRFLNHQYCYGNIASLKTIDEAFASSACDSLRSIANNRKSKCVVSCELHHICNAGCTFEAIENNDPSTPGFFSCEVVKLVVPYIKGKLNTNEKRGYFNNQIVEKMLNSI